MLFNTFCSSQISAFNSLELKTYFINIILCCLKTFQKKTFFDCLVVDVFAVVITFSSTTQPVGFWYISFTQTIPEAAWATSSMHLPSFELRLCCCSSWRRPPPPYHLQLMVGKSKFPPSFISDFHSFFLSPLFCSFFRFRSMCIVHKSHPHHCRVPARPVGK